MPMEHPWTNVRAERVLEGAGRIDVAARLRIEIEE
jgi:hypothetical protein